MKMRFILFSISLLLIIAGPFSHGFVRGCYPENAQWVRFLSSSEYEPPASSEVLHAEQCVFRV